MRGDGWGMKRMSLARGGRPGKGGGSARSAQALAPARRGRRICQCGVRAGQGKGGGDARGRGGIIRGGRGGGEEGWWKGGGSGVEVCGGGV